MDFNKTRVDIPGIKKGSIGVQSHPDTPPKVTQPSNNPDNQTPSENPAPSNNNGRKE